jgi:hypothetical protein
MLSEANALFVKRFTSMSLGARDAQNRPVVGRALGCCVSADRRRLTIFLSASRAAQLLECLRNNGAIALAVTRPTTHETLQFKGSVLDIRPLSAEERTEMEEYRESFIQELAAIGYNRQMASGVVAGPEDALAVVFEPVAIFNQTPGPKAGTKLEARP